MMKNVYILSCKKDGGIYHYLFDEGKFVFLEKIALDRPMFAIKRNGKLHVILREIDTVNHFGGILSYDIDADERLITPTKTHSTNGIVPCHLEVCGEEKFVVNYLSGNVVKIGTKTVTHSGKSVHPTRQEAPHTHFINKMPDCENLLCVDLGIDKVFIYNKKLQKLSEINISKGNGPRHAVFSGDGKLLLVACELSSTVETFSFAEGKFAHLNSYKTLPGNEPVQSTVAAIKRRGNFVYVSNRGHDSIAVFKIENNSLEPIEIVSCDGKSPRDITIVGDYLLSANELSDTVTVFKIDENGRLHKTENTLKTPCPLCIVDDE